MASVPDKPLPILVLEPSRELKFKGEFSWVDTRCSSVVVRCQFQTKHRLSESQMQHPEDCLSAPHRCVGLGSIVSFNCTQIHKCFISESCKLHVYQESRIQK